MVVAVRTAWLLTLPIAAYVLFVVSEAGQSVADGLSTEQFAEGDSVLYGRPR